MRIIRIEEFMDSCHLEVSSFAVALHRRDERIQSIHIQSGLIFVQHSIGWSGKFMRQQLQTTRAWWNTERRQIVARTKFKFKYDGWKMIAEQDRPLIHDFLDHNEWYMQNIIWNRNISLLMLIRAFSRGYLPKTMIYIDRIGGTCYYTRLYGVSWRKHVRSIVQYLMYLLYLFIIV